MRAFFVNHLMVEGTDQSLVSLAIRSVLMPFTVLYLIIVTVRNALYDNGLLKTVKVGVPVVSIGNITVGGTGKTPLTIHLANQARAMGRKVAVVTRGYGAAADSEGHTDEVALLRARCPGVEVIESPDKLRGAKQAAALGVDLILVDDGMQHRRLHRDLNICVVDARAPFGNGEVTPGGVLREPASGLARADVVVVTHHDVVDPAVLETMELRLRAFRLDVKLVWGLHTPIGVRSVGSTELAPVATLRGQDVFLFCAIAWPEGFEHTVQQIGANVTGIHAFLDHHGFNAADLARVRSQARTARLICTEKDAGKVARIPGNDDVLCLVVEMQIEGEMPDLPRPEDLPEEPKLTHGDFRFPLQ